MRPLLERFVLGLRETEVDFRAEELVDAGVAIFGQQLLRADQAERVVEVARHQVLPAFAAGERQHRHARTHSARFVRQQPAVFVIRMRHNQHHRRPRPQLAQQLLERRRAMVDGQRIRQRRRRNPLAHQVGGVVDLLGSERKSKSEQECGECGFSEHCA